MEAAARIVSETRASLGDEIVETVVWAAGTIRQIAATSAALDPAGAARATRRGVATVRGLIEATLERDERWEAFRLGTHVPRAAWIAALVKATATLAGPDPTDPRWNLATTVTGVRPVDAPPGVSVLSDRASVATVANALDQTESALLGLQRRGQLGSVPLALAREAQARMRAAATALGAGRNISATLDLLLDGIGALASAVDPRVAEPGAPPSPWLGTPVLVSSPTMG